MIRALMLSSLLLLGLSAHADSDYGLAKNAIYGSVGFTAGGFALGADYERVMNRSYGFGGYVRIYQKDDSAPGTSSGITTFGAFIRPHFTKREWDLYVSPGIGIVSIDAVGSNPGDSTTLGATLAMGVLYTLNDKASIGAESMQTHVWFDSDYRGLVMQDLMFKFRLLF